MSDTRRLSVKSAAGGLTIDTDAMQPVIVPPISVAAPSPTGPNGTPRNWFWKTSSGLTDPRSWLQSPRKWANNRTPTNHGGNATPNTKKMAAYFNTLPNSEKLMGRQEEQDKSNIGTTISSSSSSSSSSSRTTTTTTTTTAATVPTALANLMHQTDKDGKFRQVALPPSPVYKEEHEQDEQAPLAGLSLLSRLMRSIHLSDNEAAPSIATRTSLPSFSDKTGKQSPKPLSSPLSSLKIIERNGNDLLGELHPDDVGKKCLVLDLDETLVHSSFQPVEGSDFVIPIVIEGTKHQVYVLKRPGVDEFMQRVAKDYEIVIFTASLALYADPLLDQLDVHNVIRHRLYRESCTFFQGSYVKDLTKLGREVCQCILVDNSPLSYMFQPENAIGCSSYIDATMDRELDVIAAFLDDVRDCGDVREYCRNWQQWGVYGRKGQVLVGKKRGVIAG